MEVIPASKRRLQERGDSAEVADALADTGNDFAYVAYAYGLREERVRHILGKSGTSRRTGPTECRTPPPLGKEDAQEWPLRLPRKAACPASRMRPQDPGNGEPWVYVLPVLR